MPQSLTCHPRGALTGAVRIPGDKSISHRALMFAALAVGESHIEGLLEGEDVLATAAALRAFGAAVERLADGRWRVHGVGVGGFSEPEDIIDLGNSGTSARLLLGLAAGQNLSVIFTGDQSLRSRPMGRVMTPLRQIGAAFVARSGDRLPATVIGAKMAMPITYHLPVASAQVKSAILLAGLNAPGCTTVIEPAPTRDHTEHLLRHFGAEITVSDRQDGRHVTITGQPELTPADIIVPGDPSSAAFPAVAALVREGSDILLRGVNLNPLRAGLFTTLTEMGADISYENHKIVQGEPMADLRVRASRLRAVTVPADRVPSMIDEYPILAIAAAFAEGDTVMRGAAELRVKESDRIAAMVSGLRKLGVTVEEFDDGMVVRGAARTPGNDPVALDPGLDHRIAMALLCFAAAGGTAVRIPDATVPATSFPDFAGLMTELGATMEFGDEEQR